MLTCIEMIMEIAIPKKGIEMSITHVPYYFWRMFFVCLLIVLFIHLDSFGMQL